MIALEDEFNHKIKSLKENFLAEKRNIMLDY